MRYFERAYAMLRTAVVLLLCLFPAAAHADKRVALVIGNSTYRHASVLANPKNDAVDVAAALKTLGFLVVEGFDLDSSGHAPVRRPYALRPASAQ
jgi:hypothetical protein